MNERPTREQLVAKVADHIVKECGTDPVKIANWAMIYAKRAYQDGYRQGQQDTMISLVKEFMRGDDENASDFGALLQFLNSGGSGGPPRTSERASPNGGSGVPAGEGTQAGEGTGSQREEAGDSIRSTGEGDHPARPGD